METAVERLSVKVGDAELKFETGRIAKQAQGSVMVTSGDTMVLSAVTVATSMRPGQDFFPMTIDYREKSYAAGQIPGNFFRREARPSEREILICRVTDRPLRPLFPKGFLNELQVCQTVFSADNVNDPDVLSINAASAALHISKVPFLGPIGAVRVGLIEDELVIMPTIEQMEESDLDLIMAGTRDAITMVEGGAEQLPESKILEALEFGHRHIQDICDAIDKLREACGVEKMVVESSELDAGIVQDVEGLLVEKYKEVLNVKGKHEQEDASDALNDEVKAQLLEKYGEDGYAERKPDISAALGKTKKRLMREQVVSTSTRVDGRALDEVRKITIEVGVLPRAHGSCLFTRGETQAIVTTTLGTSRDEMRIDELTGDVFRRFFLHYNFPSWSVGEVRRIMGPGRREIGHGKLAERALEKVVPHSEDEDDFPYTVRIVSDITESNGSSSMATVCGGSLSMLNAGVPTDGQVAGIAMGLIKEGDEVRILSDILGAEDHLGDMDFKVAGTREGITALQMDVKITDVSRDIMESALAQAHAGRIHILDKMDECLEKPSEMSDHAPRITSISVPPDKIRDIIGPGGKVIREIQAQTGAEIDIQDDGTVLVAATDGEAAETCINMIQTIIAEPEIGAMYKGTVSRIMGFGAFVSILGKEGLVHISELAVGHVNEVTDVLNVGDEVSVKVTEVDNMGRINLSKVEADHELGTITDEEYEKYTTARAERKGRDRGGRGGGDRGGRGGGDRGGRGGGGGRGRR
jgi:polyribonucleotide nucleotidyltransferase